MARRARTKRAKSVETLTHSDATRRNLPSAEHQPLMAADEQHPVRLAYERRNRDLDPQLVWRGKDEQDLSDLVVNAPPLYIQERVHPKVLVDDLVRETGKRRESKAEGRQQEFADLFADFNGLPSEGAKTEFYRHDANWSNRMILGDSLQVMASLAEREGLHGKVQCIYIDPPYGIRFNSNFQWSTTSRDVRDGNVSHITREPEQVKAFRDTWRDGIHSYLTYLRDRLTVARNLLTDSGSIFVQIGDENVHRVRALMDEVFGEDNFVSLITVRKTTSEGASLLGATTDFIVWYGKSSDETKFRTTYQPRSDIAESRYSQVGLDGRKFRLDNITSSRPAGDGDVRIFAWKGREFDPGNGTFKTTSNGLRRLSLADRLYASARGKLNYRRFQDDFSAAITGNLWTDISGAVQSRADPKIYVVQTSTQLVQRCILMTTDPGDLVLDPTCGAGTAAHVAEQWGRRWITIDTSRVALALARARVMGARYPYYLLSDSPEGQVKQAEIERKDYVESPTYGDIRQGFVYERVPHITLRAIANNAEIDVIWEDYEERLRPLREQLSVVSGQWSAGGGSLEEWEVPRERPENWPPATDDLLTAFWERRISRQSEIDASIAAKADYEYLYDKPYENRRKVRVAGPFTVESISPHRTLSVNEDDEFVDRISDTKGPQGETVDFVDIILENLRTSGVQQAHKEDRITFNSLTPWPGRLVCAEGRYVEGGEENGTLRRAAVFIGPEFGTVSRPDLVEAAREAADGGFDVLIACAFNYEAHTTEFESLGRVPVLKARMNADLHMAGDLKNTGKGNLFVIFGEPDIAVTSGQWLVASNGGDVANYDQVKELSGLGSLEEINGVGRESLSHLCQVSDRGEVRSYQSATAVGDFDPGEHRGGVGASRDKGVSTVSGDSERLAGGDGDHSDSGAAAEHGQQGASGSTAGPGVGNRTDAQRTQTLAAVQGLTPADFPLSLTTCHRSQVTIRGVDVYHPTSGEVRSDGPDGIACWFIDTNYNEENFFVRHAYFLGANDPYKSLKTTLKAEIDADAWESLHSDTSRPFKRPDSGRIAVKVINHLGDEVMKVFRV